MRLIDADALKRNWTGIDTPVGYRKVIDLEVIDNAPTVEGPHGEWIPTVIDTGLFERSVCREWQCSNCGEVVKRKYPFCHCGADMRKEGSDEVADDKHL